MSFIRKFIYGNDPTKSELEKSLLLKIDCMVLPFICLNYWINYVDRSNVANAYVSGMKEDIGIVGNQYNVINTCFTVGYIVFMIPNNIALIKLPPRYWLSFCCLAWGLLTLGMYRVTNVKQLYVIRFFQAGFESSTFSGSHLILGSWYKETELTKRSAIFTSSGLIGNCFSGLMQAKIYANLDGRKFGADRLAGWRWLFVIDFFVTLPILIYGFFFFPDVPERCTSKFFSEDEKKLAIERLPIRTKTKLDLSVIKRVVGRWHWWLFSLLWVFGGENESFGSNALFSIYLKYFGYSVQNRNYYPMGVYATGIVATISFAWYVDLTGAKRHYQCAIFISAALLISTILLLCRPVTDSYVFAAHYISGISYSGQATFFAWANKVTQHDLEERAIILASMNMFSGLVNLWWSILFYAADDVPKWYKGCYAMIATTICASIVAVSIRLLQNKEEKNQPFDNIPDETSSNGSYDGIQKVQEVAEIKE